jgi:hypothetical protein
MKTQLRRDNLMENTALCIDELVKMIIFVVKQRLI